MKHILSSVLILVTMLVASLYSQTAPPGPTGQCSKGALFDGQYTNSAGNFHLQWVIDCDANEFSVLMTAKALGWVGFGLNNKPYMVGSYVVQAHVVNGTVEHQPGYASEYKQPDPDAVDIYSSVNGTENSTHTVIGFRRNMTLAPQFEERSISPSGNTMVFAFHSTDDSFSTFHTVYQPQPINFFTGGTSRPTDYKFIHGALMTLAFGFLAPAGTFVARFLKGIGHPWYLIHISIQYSMFAMMIAAFIIIEKDQGSSSNNHFKHPHNVIGLTIVILTFIQVLFGILANSLFKPNRDGAPIFPDKVHWWLGRLVILYSIANIFVGFNQYGYDSNSAGPYISFAVWIGVTCVLFLIGEITMGQTDHHKEAVDGKVFQQFKKPILTYVSMFVFGIILYAVTLHYMYHYRK